MNEQSASVIARAIVGGYMLISASVLWSGMTTSNDILNSLPALLAGIGSFASALFGLIILKTLMDKKG